MPLLQEPIELRAKPTFAVRFLRTSALVIVGVVAFVLALAIAVLVTTD